MLSFIHMITAKLILLPLIAFFSAIILIPIVRRFSIGVGSIDCPDDDRKCHKEAVPSSGGVAIFLAFLLAMLFLNRRSPEILGFLIGATIVTGVGLIDDVTDIPPLSKLFGQILAALIVIYAGVRIDIISSPFGGGVLPLRFLALPLTFLWIVGVTNAINLLDGLDGLAAGVVGISSATLGFISLMVGKTDVAVMAFTLAAASFAFLPYNFSEKKKIFMGDTGSNFLGFSLAVISILGAIKVATAFSMLVPIIILAIPLLDTALVILRRLKGRRSIIEADRGHFHHQLTDIVGMGNRQAVFFIYTMTLILSGVAILSAGFTAQASMAIFGVLFVFFCIIALAVISRHQARKNVGHNR